MSKRPNGLPDETNFEIVTTESNALKDGEVKLKAHDLCRPCKYLEDKLKQNNLVKEFLHKGYSYKYLTQINLFEKKFKFFS